jgi:tetratricopeptide (TPR) repeat protein
MKRSANTLLFLMMIFIVNSKVAGQETVKMWEEPLNLPAYLTGEPEKSPCFMRNFAYQRAKRAVYPYPMDDNITSKRVTREYKALYLENEYVKVCILPELGGRILYAIDKTNDYDIFYHQHVIKPANIGMPGAWISGGVEWNTFHHHRITSQMPVDYKLVENSDGSKTIWVGETEFRHRMRWAIGVSLHPGKSYMEISGRLINSTQNKNSFLYWSNVATHANKDYQIIFPESTDFGVMHAKNSFCHWPVTHEVYNGREHYKNGVDASWWIKNDDLISIFVYDLKDGFIAGYDYGKDAGTMLAGNPNIVKGGKFFLWGPGPYGEKWDSEILTETDGPYVELMVGAYSDNQPDYSWLNPYETKTFTKYWYGIRNMEGAKAGNRRASLNMEFKPDNNVMIAANTTEVIGKANIALINTGGEILYRNETAIAPDKPFRTEIKLPVAVTDKTKVKLILSDDVGREIISYQPVIKDTLKPLPETVKPPLKPAEIKTNEELYLTGLRNVQFHNAFVNPLDYFGEALQRDPFDIRCNTQMGIYYRERGNYDQAAMYLRKAIKRMTNDYTRPRDCEALYHLGLILKEQGNYKAATDTLYRAAWDYNFMSPSYYQLAQISVKGNKLRQALDEVSQSLNGNALNLNALNLKTTILRKLEDYEMAKELTTRVLSVDPINTYTTYELCRIAEANQNNRSEQNYADFKKLMRDKPETYLELAINYLNNGFVEEAKNILHQADQSTNEKLKNYPTIKYYLGYISDLSGEPSTAKEYFSQAVSLPTDYCFPFRLETVGVYKKALEYLPDAANTCYYLGNLLFDKQPDVAMEYWQKAIEKQPDFAMAYRNLGWGYKFHVKDAQKAIRNYEKAISMDNSLACWFTELDEVYESAGVDVSKRLEMLVQNHRTTVKRYDSFVREIRMLIINGEYDQAISYLTTHFFSRQEGVNDLHDIFADVCLLAGEKMMKEKKYPKAYSYFQMADQYPDNQNYARWKVYPRNAQIYYLTGKALQKLGKNKDARKYFELASTTETKSSAYDYFKALALQEIDKTADASLLYDNLIAKGESEITGYVENFFVSFGPGQTVQEVNAEANFTIGLGYLGKGETTKAKEFFQKALETKPDHLWAIGFLKKSDN